MPKGLSAKVTVHEGNTGGKSTLRRFHLLQDQRKRIDSLRVTMVKVSNRHKRIIANDSRIASLKINSFLYYKK